MKQKLIFSCIFFVFTFQIVNAQRQKPYFNYIPTLPPHNTRYPDSIRVEFTDHKALVIFRFRNISRSGSFIEEFPVRLKDWLANITAGTANTSTPRKVTIEVRQHEEGEVRMTEKSELTTRIRTHEKNITELLPPGWEISINYNNVQVDIYGQTFKDLEALAQESFQNVGDKLKGEHFLHRKSLNSRFVIQNGKIAFEDTKRIPAGDLLEINMSGGLGFLGDKIYPELNPLAHLEFFNRYHRKDFRFSFSYNTLFFTERNPDGGFTTRPNSFVNVGWSKNLALRGDPSWIGLGAGLLVRRNGDYFKGQTVKLFISKSVGSFSLSPELYLTNDYKKALAGFRINYSF